MSKNFYLDISVKKETKAEPTQAINEYLNALAKGVTNYIRYKDSFHTILTSIKCEQEITYYDRKAILINAEKNLRKTKIFTKNDLLKELNKEGNKYFNASTQTYVLVSSISVNRNSQLHNINLNDGLVSFTDTNKYLAKRTVLLQANGIKNRINLPSLYKEVEIKVQSKSISNAIQLGIDSLDLYRSISNLCINNHHYKPITTFKNYQPDYHSPINKILSGPIHTLHKLDGDLATDTYYWDEEYRKPVVTYRYSNIEHVSDYIHNVRNLLSSIRLNNEKYYRDLVDAILQYGRALDYYDRGISVLMLWGTLEKLTNIIDGFNSDTTIRRVSFLYKDRTRQKEILKVMRELRNFLAHTKGMVELEEIDYWTARASIFVQDLIEVHLNNAFSSMNEAGEIMQLPNDSEELDNKIEELDNKMKIYNKAKHMLRFKSEQKTKHINPSLLS